MKKLILLIFAIFLFGFNLNQNYTCKTLGIEIQRNGKMYQIPNNEKTTKNLQKDLKDLYKINITPIKNALKIKVGQKKDILPFVKKLKKNFNIYITKDKDVIVFLDRNVSQIALKIPANKMVIYYQCK